MSGDMEIKRGDLVKAWNNDPSEFVIGRFTYAASHVHVIIDLRCQTRTRGDQYLHAVKIPKELLEQLENLGV